MSIVIESRTVQGKLYELRADSCYGCAADKNPELCRIFGNTCWDDERGNHVWVEVPEPTVPKERVKAALFALVYPYGDGYRSALHEDSEVPAATAALLKELEQ